MKILFSLYRCIARALSAPDPKDQGKGENLRDLARSKQLLLIGLRSPGDHLHVVAIKPFDD